MKTTKNRGDLAAQVVEKHFARFRGKPEIFGDTAGTADATRWLRWCLGESDLLGPEERERCYLAIVEDLWPDGYAEGDFGDTAFELLVQFARYYGACRVTPRVLRLVREHSMALEVSEIDLLDLAHDVTDECRRRYRPHVPPLGRPAEIVAPPLRREDAARLAVRYWVARYREELAATPGKTDSLERDILREPAESGAAKVRFLHDLREGFRLSPPNGGRARREDIRRYRANVAVALAAAIDVQRRSGLGFDAVAAERARHLAKLLGTTARRAFGYLYYLARHSRRAH